VFVLLSIVVLIMMLKLGVML